MKLLLIGHSAEDHIHYKDNIDIKPGGLYYTSSALLNIKEEEDQVYLITSIEEKRYHLFSKVYDQMNTDYSVREDGIVPIVRLNIYDDREREEKYERLGGKLQIPYEILSSFDGILINMISGFDITLEQLKEIRKNFSRPVYMDVHTLTRGVGKNLERPQTVIPGFSEWAECLDIIQVNQTELFSLYNVKSERAIARKVLDAGAKCLIVTKEDKGAKIYYKEKNELSSLMISALKVNAKNKVGCGDIFGAIFFYTFIKFGSIIKSLELANYAAGMITSYNNFDDIVKLKYDVFSRHN
jgi:sugar/nucleoside kinase (ribokinase family)